MALFGKKSDSPAGASGGTATAPPSGGSAKGGLFGRGKKKGDDAPAPVPNGAPVGAPPGAAPGPDDFSDFSDFGAPVSEVPRGPIVTTRAKPKVVGGSAIGLNIGNNTIKAVELRAQGGTVRLVGAAMVHTPLESLSNGVIMSQGALSHAIRSAIQAAGIKSKAVTTAVAGTGSIVVRVVEMPRMSDSELAETMKTDAEKFIPFAPEEVRLDFRPLRELPTPPDSPSMDVLIAAAQREVLYQYGDSLRSAKLTPRAIEVEPLAVARAVGYSTGGAEVDYARVTAVINIGATATEISVLRGDILVFTRTLPTGGHSLTQALVDYLGLSDSEAERVKQEFGDALPAFQNTGAAAAGTGAGDFDDWSSLDFDTPTGGTATASTSGAPSDPFDADLFSQGPTGSAGSNVSLQKDAGEQHGQKEGEDDPKPGFDFSSFDFGDLGSDDPAKPAASQPATPAASPSDPTQSLASPADVQAASPESAGGGFNFDFDAPTAAGDEPVTTSAAPPATTAGDTTTVISFDKGTVNSGTTEGTDANTAPSPSPSAPSTSEAPAASPSLDPNAFNFSFDDVSTEAPAAPAPTPAPDVPEPAGPPATTAAPVAATASATPFDFDFPSDAGAAAAPAASTGSEAGAPTDMEFGAGPPVTDPTMSVIPADDDSAWGLDDPADATASTATPSAAGALGTPVSLGKAPGAAPSAAADDFDLDAIFNAPGAGAGAAGAAAGGALAGGALAGGVAGATDDPFNVSQDFGNFGQGLTNDIAPGVDAPTVYSILHPLLDELAGEIRRSLEYHASRYPEAVVQSIELVGGGAKLRNLDAFLTQSLGIPASVGDPMRGLSGDIPPQIRADSPAYAVAIGLALRELLA